MNLSTKFVRTLFVAGFLASLAGCSSAPTVQDFPDTASASEEVMKLDTDLKSAAKDQVHVLAPRNFKEAEDSLHSAKKSLDKQRNEKDTLHIVAQSRAYLNRAQEFAKMSHSNIEDVIVARRQAIEANAPVSFAEEFKKTENDLTDVTSAIEKNNLENAIENRASLQLRYLQLELQAIKNANLGPARDKMAQAVKEGAKDFAPRTLAVAEKSIQDTDAFITANRHDTAQVSARSAATLKSAEHLWKITREAKSGGKASLEDIALRMESEQNKVVDKQDQLNAKEDQLDDLAAQNRSKQIKLEKGESENKALVAENNSLESEQAFLRRFEEARSQFNKNEAEVYKQGNTLMIRLRGLEFPVSGATLKEQNFPLLAKVQRVIKNFGKSSVIIEGHTDSNGEKALNEKLSHDRAEAVKAYLSSNNGSQLTHIEAVGYGDQKPLSSNKTNSGRAQNRRVDVRIQPDANATVTN